MSRRKKTSGEVKARSALSPEAVQGTLLEGQSLPVLQALGLVTPRGGASADAHRKIKQISHFVQQIAPALDDLFERHPEPVLVDAAAGKAYLGLVIYERWIARHGRGRLIAIEGRPDLVTRVQGIATELGFDRLEVQPARIAEAEWPERVHFAMALHACDTATDEALAMALAAKADHVALVPCCQAEVARLLKEVDAGPADLWRHAWHRREFGAHLTNVIRALALQSYGYQVTVTELAGWEHSLKNELILGRRVARFHAGAERQLAQLLEQIPVRPWLLEHLPPRET
ncbi:MAG: SAM-dependent methyltransferase [Deltaproteobacteria bacterium]|nr:SAM-dependent methyltransferase [Deltaproteobacteria bacterium]